ncbi:MAG: hypothetical protein KTR31_39670 [Myxococcales bacterium]|nr:hypothetical protein [Myxococcales bacterium]
MPSPGSLQPVTPAGALQPFDSKAALEQLPRRQALWVAGSTATALLTAATSLWTIQPEIALTLTIAVGAALVHPRKLWAAPLVAAGVTLAGLLFFLLQAPAVIGAGAMAGALATWMVPQRTDWVDSLNGALGGLAGSSIGLWVATSLIPAALPVSIAAALTAGTVALVGSQGLLPAALRFDHQPQLPSIREIQRALKVAYRPPVFRAIDLYKNSQAQAPDHETRKGMAEVATWVFRLQVTLQTLDMELAQIDPEQVRNRISQNRDLPPETDDFTRDRRNATAHHLERLLDHREVIAVERRRTDALVDYALAFLEEARAGLAVARRLPGEAVPDRLPEVLDRLRNQAKEGDARRRTARELDHLEV